MIACGQLKQLLTQLRPGYDWVILRGPPVIGVSATRLIAAAVDATILVVRSKTSRLPAVREALDLLASSVTLDAFADVSPQIVTVLTDAPKTSVPAAFRDRKAKRPDEQFNPSVSATRSPSDAGPEKSADGSNPDNGPNSSRSFARTVPMMAIGRRRQLLLAGARIRGAEISPWTIAEEASSFSIDRAHPLEDVVSIAKWAIWEILKGRG